MFTNQEREGQFAEIIRISGGERRFSVFDGYWEYRWLSRGRRESVQETEPETGGEPLSVDR